VDPVSAALLALNIFLLLTCYYVLKVLREPMILLGGGAELKAYASAGQTILLLIVVPVFGLVASRVNRVRLLTIVQPTRSPTSAPRSGSRSTCGSGSST
jgi:hypothetical protein